MSSAEAKLGIGLVILFERFETLDAFGPVETLGSAPGVWDVRYCSRDGGIVRSVHGVPVETVTAPRHEEEIDFILVPGGIGTRQLSQDSTYRTWLAALAGRSQYVLSVCTGSGLLAAAGVLDGVRATSNKMAFDWARSQGAEVEWVGRARWVADGTCYTSSGVSAGIDMSLAFVSDRLGEEYARKIAVGIEYTWNSDSNNDPFAVDLK